MPAVTTNDILSLPRIPRPGLEDRPRQATKIVDSLRTFEGAGFPVRRPFPTPALTEDTDPFLLLDHMVAAYEPHEAKGAPWHPHRGFETVTYLMDGTFVHTDSHGGGGVIRDGDTQWMTAGSGLLHDELPSEKLVMNGGVFDGIQLWVNLPANAKMSQPNYQDIQGPGLTLVSSDDGGALVRVIAGTVGEHHGPGQTHTPISLVHASLAPGARLQVPWNRDYSAMAFLLHGEGTVGDDRRAFTESQLALFGTGDYLTVEAGPEQTFRSGHMEVLLLGGQPIHEPVARYGPFVMNTRAEIVQAVEDFQAGRMGQIPPGYEGREYAPDPADELPHSGLEGDEKL
ncbi:pirin family protein [Natronoglycomyces albus]|uniref:Pirin family protein n=1 Tax=Natronoglycomyces albus TaxID=2811108 RepID=A0A895XZ08_9ACTN|nr:pirin family protein [Natronoglycomyces albus]QSB06838.1 pirin family protein [Natronoglycomyces albus]